MKKTWIALLLALCMLTTIGAASACCTSACCTKPSGTDEAQTMEETCTCIIDGKAMADLITTADEQVETQHGITLFDPIETWKECTYVNCTARCLSTPIYENGKRVYQSPSLDDIKKFCKAQVNTCLLYTSPSPRDS